MIIVNQLVKEVKNLLFFILKGGGEYSSVSIAKSKRQRVHQRNLSGYGIITDSATKEKLDEQIARLFYSCNLAFNIADNQIFKDTIELLCPGYSPPSRKDIGGYLLDNVHEKLKTNLSHMRKDLVGKNAALILDGWSDIHNTPVIASSLHCDGKSYFLSAVDTGTNKKTAQYCTDIATNAKADDTFGCNITGVVTDSEKKMQVTLYEGKHEGVGSKD